MIRRSRVGLVFAALALGLFWRVFLLGETLIATDFIAASPVWKDPPGFVRNPWMSDTVEYYYPAEKLSSEHARRGELPLSNPYVFNGTPVPHGVHIWNSVWPVKLAFLWLFDPVRSYDFFAIFHWWLAGVAMAAFLRSRGLGGFAAFAGALAYALSGRAMLWLHGHYLMPTMAYVPLLFLWARSPLAALPAAGLFFTNPHLAIAASAAVVVFERSSWKAVLAGLLMAGVALVPLASAVLGGVRDPVAEAGYFYRDGWRSWLLLAGLVAPELRASSMEPNEWNAYVGLLPLAGAFAAWRRDRFFGGLAALALALATLYPVPVWISSLSFSLPTRYLFFFTFGACVLFARALELRPRDGWVRAGVVALLLVDLGPRFLAWNRTYDPAPLRETPGLAAELRGRTGWILRDHPQLPRAVVPPLSILGVPSVQGYDAMVPKAHEAAIRGAAEVGGGRTVRILDPDHPALEALGMRFLLSDRPLELKRFRLVRDGTVRVYENPRAPDVPPRPASKAPLWVGLAATLAGGALAVVLGRGGRPPAGPASGAGPGAGGERAGSWIEAALAASQVGKFEPSLADLLRTKLEMGGSRYPALGARSDLSGALPAEPRDDLDRWLHFCADVLVCSNHPGIPHLEGMASRDPSVALWIVAAGRTVLERSGHDPSSAIRASLRRMAALEPGFAAGLGRLSAKGAEPLRRLATLALGIMEGGEGWDRLLSR